MRYIFEIKNRWRVDGREKSTYACSLEEAIKNLISEETLGYDDMVRFIGFSVY